MVNNIDIKRLFIIDSITSALFGISLIGIAYQIPTAVNIALQVVFIFFALSQTYTLIRRKFFGMAFIKTLMLITLIIIDFLA